MFKIIILQLLYNLSDDQVEFQIRDMLSLMRFLVLSLSDTVPDSKTIWLFIEQLTESKLVKNLFNQFDEFLDKNGFPARKGQIVDAGIIAAPKQRNSRQENKDIKDGNIPDDWTQNKRRPKDTDARWVKKNGKSRFVYKNHIDIDVEHKLIRDYEVTPASVHDGNIFEQILDEDNSSRDVWADSAYGSEEKIGILEAYGFRSHVQRKGCSYKKLDERQIRGNHKRAKIRCRIEHIFGVQAMRSWRLLIRTIELSIRAKWFI